MKLVRLTFIKYPPANSITLNQVYELVFTITTDLGDMGGSGIGTVPLTLSIQPFQLDHRMLISNQLIKKNLNLKLAVIESKSLLPKSITNQSVQLQITGGDNFLQYKLKFKIELLASQPLPLPIQIKLEVGTTTKNCVNMPGGNIVDDFYFLSLYSEKLIVVKSNSSVNQAIADRHRRYFHLKESFITLIERPFGKDLGSHGWDCAWLSLLYLYQLLTPQLLTTELQNPNDWFKLSNQELKITLESILFGGTDKVNILELGSGCSLLSLGLLHLISNVIFSSNSSTKYKITFTDLQPILSRVINNLNANLEVEIEVDKLIRVHPNCQLLVQALDWSNPLPPKISSPNLILAFDVVYNDTAHIPLYTTLKNLVNLAKNEGQPLPIVLLGYKVRSTDVELNFFELIKPTFTVKKLLYSASIYLLVLQPIE